MAHQRWKTSVWAHHAGNTCVWASPARARDRVLWRLSWRRGCGVYQKQYVNIHIPLSLYYIQGAGRSLARSRRNRRDVHVTAARRTCPGCSRRRACCVSLICRPGRGRCKVTRHRHTCHRGPLGNVHQPEQLENVDKHHAQGNQRRGLYIIAAHTNLSQFMIQCDKLS